MRTIFKNSASPLLFAAIALPATGVAAQELDPATQASDEARYETQAQDENSITVYGQIPADLSQLEEGPDIEGILSAQDRNRIQVTAEDGGPRVVGLSEGTVIKGSGGFLGLSKEEIASNQLLNGLPVEVETVHFGETLVASKIKYKKDDYETAQMIRNGTAQQFAQQGAAIDKNTQATEALRTRFGDIDQYNVKDVANVYFDTNEWKLDGEAESNLCQVASQADAMDNALLLVVGYTDSDGPQEYNQTLSERRAGRVTNFLQQECGWAPYRMLTPTGMAEADPAADNTTEYGKAQNRRVSVNILVSKAVDNQGAQTAANGY